MRRLHLSDETIDEILRFRDERNWAPFHNPKDLAASISIEAGELLECFQWSGESTNPTTDKEHVQEELVDVLVYTLYLADRLRIDLDFAVKDKLTKNAVKYPIKDDKSR